MTFANSYSYLLFYFMIECIRGGSSVPSLYVHFDSFCNLYSTWDFTYINQTFKITGHWDTLMQKWVTTIYVRKICTLHGCNTVSGRINFILVMTKLLVQSKPQGDSERSFQCLVSLGSLESVHTEETTPLLHIKVTHSVQHALIRQLMLALSVILIIL